MFNTSCHQFSSFCKQKHNHCNSSLRDGQKVRELFIDSILKYEYAPSWFVSAEDQAVGLKSVSNHTAVQFDAWSWLTGRGWSHARSSAFILMNAVSICMHETHGIAFFNYSVSLLAIFLQCTLRTLKKVMYIFSIRSTQDASCIELGSANSSGDNL